MVWGYEPMRFAFAFRMSNCDPCCPMVPVMRAACPQCGTDHLHAAVYIDAEHGDRYEVKALRDDGQTVVVRFTPDGRISLPEEAALSCCACDWTSDCFIRWEGDSPPRRSGGFGRLMG